MSNNSLNKIRNEFEGLKFLIRNLKASRHLNELKSISYKDYIFTGLTKDRIQEWDDLHQLVREGRRLNYWRKMLYRFRGKSLCAAAINHNNKLVGFIFYYFRNDEIPKDIIHEAFAGIHPDERGKGLATALTIYSLEQLANQQLTGVSGYVERNNYASVKMLQRVGYEIEDDPKDPDNNYYVFYHLI